MATFGGAQPIVTDGLVFTVDAANYQSYPGSGTTWSDIISDGDGILTNGPVFGDNPKHFEFDGIDDYFRYDIDLRTYSNITALMWVKENVQSGEWDTYFSYASEEGGLTKGWGIRRSIATTRYQYWGGIDSLNLQLFINNKLISSGNGPFITTGYNVNILGEWQQLALTVEGVINFNNNRIGFAARNDTFNGAFTNIEVSHFVVYNRILTALEITQNYNALKGRFGL
jgi:hypothetical protein